MNLSNDIFTSSPATSPSSKSASGSQLERYNATRFLKFLQELVKLSNSNAASDSDSDTNSASGSGSRSDSGSASATASASAINVNEIEDCLLDLDQIKEQNLVGVTLDSAQGMLLSVKRLTVDPMPAVPTELAGWLIDGSIYLDEPKWYDRKMVWGSDYRGYTTPPSKSDIESDVKYIAFEEIEGLGKLKQEYTKTWKEWASHNRKRQRTLELFTKLNQLRLDLNKANSDRGYFLANGFVKSKDGHYNYPLLLQRVNLTLIPAQNYESETIQVYADTLSPIKLQQELFINSVGSSVVRFDDAVNFISNNEAVNACTKVQKQLDATGARLNLQDSDTVRELLNPLTHAPSLPTIWVNDYHGFKWNALTPWFCVFPRPVLLLDYTPSAAQVAIEIMLLALSYNMAIPPALRFLTSGFKADDKHHDEELSDERKDKQSLPLPLAKRIAFACGEDTVTLPSASTAADDDIIDLNRDDTDTSSYDDDIAAEEENNGDHLMLMLKASLEQIQVIRECDYNDVVLVQAPTGTGKSHTIANLVGNFLAHGKRVLVTSENTNTLTVIRDLIPTELQSLCFTLWGEANDYLQQDIATLCELLKTKHTPQQLRHKLREYTTEREAIMTKLVTLRDKLSALHLQEQTPVTILDEERSLSQWGMWLKDHEYQDSTLLDAGVTLENLSLNRAELTELYKLNLEISSDDAAELQCHVPNPYHLPSSSTIRDLLADQGTLEQSQSRVDAQLVAHEKETGYRIKYHFDENAERLYLVLQDKHAETIFKFSVINKNLAAVTLLPQLPAKPKNDWEIAAQTASILQNTTDTWLEMCDAIANLDRTQKEIAKSGISTIFIDLKADDEPKLFDALGFFEQNPALFNSSYYRSFVGDRGGDAYTKKINTGRVVYSHADAWVRKAQLESMTASANSKMWRLFQGIKTEYEAVQKLLAAPAIADLSSIQDRAALVDSVGFFAEKDTELRLTYCKELFASTNTEQPAWITAARSARLEQALKLEMLQTQTLSQEQDSIPDQEQLKEEAAQAIQPWVDLIDLIDNVHNLYQQHRQGWRSDTGSGSESEIESNQIESGAPGIKVNLGSTSSNRLQRLMTATSWFQENPKSYHECNTIFNNLEYAAHEEQGDLTVSDVEPKWLIAAKIAAASPERLELWQVLLTDITLLQKRVLQQSARVDLSQVEDRKELQSAIVWLQQNRPNLNFSFKERHFAKNNDELQRYQAILQAVTIDGHTPNSADDLTLMAQALEVETVVPRVCSLWSHLMTEASAFTALGYNLQDCVKEAVTYQKAIERAIAWWGEIGSAFITFVQEHLQTDLYSYLGISSQSSDELFYQSIMEKLLEYFKLIKQVQLQKGDNNEIDTTVSTTDLNATITDIKAIHQEIDFFQLKKELEQQWQLLMQGEAEFNDLAENTAQAPIERAVSYILEIKKQLTWWDIIGSDFMHYVVDTLKKSRNEYFGLSDNSSYSEVYEAINHKLKLCYEQLLMATVKVNSTNHRDGLVLSKKGEFEAITNFITVERNLAALAQLWQQEMQGAPTFEQLPLLERIKEFKKYEGPLQEHLGWWRNIGKVLYAYLTHKDANNAEQVMRSGFGRDQEVTHDVLLEKFDEYCRILTSAQVYLTKNGPQSSDLVRSPNTIKVVERDIRCKQQEKALAAQWDQLMVNATPYMALGDSSASRCQQAMLHVDTIKYHLNWYNNNGKDLVKAIDRVLEPNAESIFGFNGIDSDDFYRKLWLFNDVMYAPLLQVAKATHQYLLFNEQLHSVQKAFADLKGEAVAGAEVEAGPKPLCAAVLRLEKAAFESLPLYQQELENLKRLYAKQVDFTKRDKLLEKLQQSAPLWAQGIRSYSSDFAAADTKAINDLVQSQLETLAYRTVEQHFAENYQDNFELLQQEARVYVYKYQEATCRLTVTRAWQRFRANFASDPNFESKLETWRTIIAKTNKAIKASEDDDTKAKDSIRVYTAEAQDVASKCLHQLPVIMMPIAAALRSSSPTKPFDVIIVDDASKSNLTYAPLLFCANKVILMSDEKQTVPTPLKLPKQGLAKLKATYLSSAQFLFPLHLNLIDEGTSLYDLGKYMANSRVQLHEHWRSRPDIIGFSNKFCYDNKLVPQRTYSKAKLPQLVTYHVMCDDNRQDNEQEQKIHINLHEATHIVALIKACLSRAEYSDTPLSIGIIVLNTADIAAPQVSWIQNLVQTNLTQHEIAAHQIRVGSPDDLQGTEFDVVFVSLVDYEAVFRKKEEEAELMRLCNIAVSRAREQLWVVFSPDALSDFAEENTSFHLLNYIRKTLSAAYYQAQDLAKAQDQDKDQNQALAQTQRPLQTLSEMNSPLASDVYSDLIKRDYMLTPQYEINGQKVDFLVTGANPYNSAKVVLECDGSPYFAPDISVMNAAKMIKQRILEHYGYTVLNIRGGEYYRNPEATIDKLCSMLLNLGIEPQSRTADDEQAQNQTQNQNHDSDQYNDPNQEFFKDLFPENIQQDHLIADIAAAATEHLNDIRNQSRPNKLLAKISTEYSLSVYDLPLTDDDRFPKETKKPHKPSTVPEPPAVDLDLLATFKAPRELKNRSKLDIIKKAAPDSSSSNSSDGDGEGE